MYDRRPIRRSARSSASTRPAASSPESRPLIVRRKPGHQPGADQKLDVADPERPRPERDREQIQRQRHDDRDRDRRHDRGADERVVAGDVEDQRDRDDRQGQLVGEQPLVEIDREAHDE